MKITRLATPNPDPHSSTKFSLEQHSQFAHRSDGDLALELAGRLLVAPLHLDAGPALRGNLADGLAALPDDRTHDGVVHQHEHAPGLLRRAREPGSVKLADGRELEQRDERGNT